MHTTNLRKVGGSVMLAVPPALLDILHLRAGAKVGIDGAKRTAGRGAAAAAALYAGRVAGAMQSQGCRAARKSANGSMPSLPAAR